MSMPIPHYTTPWIKEEMIHVGPYFAGKTIWNYYLWYSTEPDGSIGTIYLPGGGTTNLTKLKELGIPFDLPRIPRGFV